MHSEKRTRSIVSMAIMVLACGCNDDGPSYDARLADLAVDLRVIVRVIGTSMPPTARRLQVELDPGPTATHDSAELCPVVHAIGTVDGLPLRQRTEGGWSGQGGCDALLFDREIPADLPPEHLGEKTIIEVRDGSSAIVIEILNVITAPRASWLSPPDGALRPGAHATILVEPSPQVLPERISGDYHATEPPLSFGLSALTITSSGLDFDVLPSASPSMGFVSFEGRNTSSAFHGIVTRCSGAAVCEAERSVCWDLTCQVGIAYGAGFDRLELPASVTAP